MKSLNDLYSSPNNIRVIKSRRLRWAGHVACIGAKRSAYRLLIGKTEGKPRLRWGDNIRIALQEVGWGHGLDWSGSG